MRDVVDRLDRMGVEARALLLIGGGAHSRLWAQMRADIAQRPAELPDCIDCAPIGAALLAAVAGGVARDLSEAVAALSDGHTDIEPDRRQADAYDAAHERYRQLFHALRPLFTEQARN